MLVPPESSSAVLVMMRSKSVSICKRFHARSAYSGKITISKGYPSLMPSFRRSMGISSPSGTKLPHRKLETLDYHMVKTRSLYTHLALNRYRVVTDGQTDRIVIANTRSQKYLPVQLSRVKIVSPSIHYIPSQLIMGRRTEYQ